MKELLNAFNGGEVSPVLAGRVDIPGMRRSCRILRNFIPGVTGGAFRRPSTFHVAMAVPAECRLIPFVAGTGAAFQLVLGGGFIRVYSIDETLAAELVTGFAGADVHAVQYVQSNDVLWLCHADYPVHEVLRTATGWVVQEMPWQWPPFRTENLSGTTIAASAVTGSVVLTASAPFWDAGHVGAFWQVSHFRETGSVEISVPVSSRSQATLTVAGTPTPGEQFSINGVIYKWVSDAAPLAANEIHAHASNSVEYAVAAINGAGGDGVGLGTVAHPSVTAVEGEKAGTGSKATGVLTCTGNDLTAGDPDQVIIGSVTYTFKTTVSAAYDVKVGATIADSMANLVAAINLASGSGTLYGTGTLVHPSVSAAAPIGGKVTVTAKVAGSAGNSVATTVANTSRLSWAAENLTGGAEIDTCRLIVSAKVFGNTPLTVSETMANGTWGGVVAGSLTDATSETLEVKGAWEFTTYGRWQGRVYIEQQNSAGGWDVIRQFDGRLDANKTASGVADTMTKLRLRVKDMAGDTASDVPNPRFVLEAVESLVHGLVRITGVTSPTTASGTVVATLHSTEATPNWREGAFSAARGFPVAVALHEERLLFAGTKAEPQTVWGSTVGDFRDFEETGLADGSWQYRFTSQQANPIRFLFSGRGLVIGTSGSERVWDSGDQGITPQAPPIQRQLTYNGCDPVMPVGAGNVVLFVQRGGTALLEYGYENASDSYIAPDLTQLVEHLTASGLRVLAMQRSPWPVIWAVTYSGALLSCTYARREEVVGWAWHNVGGAVLSVSVVPGSTGTADEVWLVVMRDGTRRIERIEAEHWEQLRYGGLVYHIDAAVKRTALGGFVGGLDHLEGKVVHLLHNGVEIPERTVFEGRIMVSGTGPVIVGLAGGKAELQPALFDVVTDTGSSVGRRLACKKVHVRFYETRECQYAKGPDAEIPYDVPFRESSGAMERAPELFSGVRAVSVNAAFGDGVNVVFSASGIHPLNILNLVPEFELYGQ